MIDPQAAVLELTVAGKDVTIKQSPALLHSNKREGTTGAAVWKVTPLFAEWMASPTNPLFSSGLLSSDSTVIELGCGAAGIVSLVMSPRVKTYIATDQAHVTKLAKENIAENISRYAKASSNSSTKHHAKSKKEFKTPVSNVHVTPLDWQTDSIDDFLRRLSLTAEATDISAIIACDCVYNDALIEPLTNTLVEIAKVRDTSKPPTIVLIAQQLRSSEVFESWLSYFARFFKVWRLPDSQLPEGLRENTGFVVHLGILR
ncbi:hypothetical protein K402DRAFT_397371 [Aulographum hederae CBS 113979]|uniref:S-adenosyl-L-methionine-dependent methyltransferase n=1 Tax=Aulographum hederae CBS 113979 TaxID=1176131 RepID=A0A6G1GNZ9_9PEZI|nr:hypothetical protein K402DRAFT_397371 [Aulographum hederae CBS 113979]